MSSGMITKNATARDKRSGFNKYQAIAASIATFSPLTAIRNVK